MKEEYYNQLNRDLLLLEPKGFKEKRHEIQCISVYKNILNDSIKKSLEQIR